MLVYLAAENLVRTLHYCVSLFLWRFIWHYVSLLPSLCTFGWCALLIFCLLCLLSYTVCVLNGTAVLLLCCNTFGLSVLVTCCCRASVRFVVLLVCWFFFSSVCGSLRSSPFCWSLSTLLGGRPSRLFVVDVSKLSVQCVSDATDYLC